MSDFLIQSACLFTLFIIGMAFGIGLLLRYPRTPGQVDSRDFWDAHAILNAINKLALESETGKKVDTELIYLIGEHLKCTAILQQHNGWLEAQQLDDWIISVVGLHRQLRNQEASAVRVDVRVPTGMRRMQTKNLTRAVLWLLRQEVFVRQISVIALRPMARNYGGSHLQTQVTLRLDLIDQGNRQPEPLKPSPPWREAPDGAMVCEIYLPCEYLMLEAVKLR